MAQTYTFTCNSSTTIGYALYGSSTWNTGSTNGACQGAYQATAASGSRVGVMVFTNAGTVLRGKVIQSIVFSITCSGAGSSSSSKVLTFKQANYQAPASGLKGSDMVGTTLGTLTGKFYSNTTTHTLNASSNASLFRNMAAYFAAGNQTLVLHNGETSTSSGYSTNYARVTSITITVTYVAATVWYNNNGTWVQCAVYYCNAGTWVQVTPYYNSGGTWVQV